MLCEVGYTLLMYLCLYYYHTRTHKAEAEARAYTHTRTHDTTHTTQPARQRHHLGTATHGTTSASRSANITQQDTLPKGRGNLKIFRSARGQSTSHIFWVFHMGSPFLFFSGFSIGGSHDTCHKSLHNADHNTFHTLSR